jgi:hypothetical protein
MPVSDEIAFFEGRRGDLCIISGVFNEPEEIMEYRTLSTLNETPWVLNKIENEKRPMDETSL